MRRILLTAGLAIAAATACAGDSEAVYAPEEIGACLEEAGMDVVVEERESSRFRDLHVELAGNAVSVRVYARERGAVEREEDRLFYAEQEQEGLFARRRNVYLEWDRAPTEAQADAVYACVR